MADIIDELVSVLRYDVEGEHEITRFNRTLDKTESSLKRRSRSIQGVSRDVSRTIKNTELVASQSLGKLNKQVGSSNDKLSLLATSIKTIAAGVTVGKAASLARDSFLDFAGLQREMTRIGITAEATADKTAKATETVKTLAISFGFKDFRPAIDALDTLTASGLNLEESLAFLPSVLATAQASGSSTRDIANTAIKAASALNIKAKEMQRAFDIMVAGGKAGQFELRDMAQFIPELANSFASLGYTGESGLQVLIALLQTVREDTGSASAAATQLQNIFGKMMSAEQIKRFSEFNIDLVKELDRARKNGDDLLQTFIKLSNQAIDGDLTKLPLLFRDQEFRLGMQSLITSTDSFEKFLHSVNNAEIDGGVFKDLNRVLEDTQANIDRLSSNWDRLKTNLGARLSTVVSPYLESLNTSFEVDAIVKEQRKVDKETGQGSFFERGVAGELKILRRAAKRILEEQGESALKVSAIPETIKTEVIENAKTKDALSLTENSTNNIVNDSRVVTNDHRVSNVTNNVSIEQNVTQPTDAPREAARATANAVKNTIPNRAQLESEPVAP